MNMLVSKGYQGLTKLAVGTLRNHQAIGHRMLRSGRVSRKNAVDKDGVPRKEPAFNAEAHDMIYARARGRNTVTAIGLLGFVAGTYFYSISMVKQDDLSEIEELTKVNIHQSGELKATKVLKQEGKQQQDAANSQNTNDEEGADLRPEAVTAETNKIQEGEGKKKKRGWRKYILFGPRKE
mmetsp:Transcript_30607/g.53066  ORF Transcript_30607/g.53066 Transcript_30607/m.53066 type:complete len:180 (-) Transcript_30607:133-672(-)